MAKYKVTVTSKLINYLSSEFEIEASSKEEAEKLALVDDLRDVNEVVTGGCRKAEKVKVKLIKQTPAKVTFGWNKVIQDLGKEKL